MMRQILKSTYLKILPIIATFEPLINVMALPKKPPNLNPAGKIPKIAFVKQEIYLGLYCCESNSDPAKLLASSLKHSGPMALFTELGADCWIVKEEMDPECQVWTQVVTECGHGTLEEARSLKTKPFLDGKRGHTQAPGQFAVSVDSIDWGKYDIVISVNGSVPARVTEKFPQTVWTYLIDHTTMSSYTESSRKLLKGYDLFLNLRFRSVPLLPRPPAKFEIEFPFNLQKVGCFHKAYKSEKNWLGERSGIFIEHHSEKLLTPEQLKELAQYGPLYFVRPRTEDIIQDLMKAKYYLRFGGRLLWGSGMIEGVVAGALALGNPTEYVNRGLFTPSTSVTSWKELINRLRFFEDRGKKEFKKSLEEQQQLLNWLCYYRPMSQLIKKGKTVLESRGFTFRAT